jgi:hypothetical protein
VVGRVYALFVLLLDLVVENLLPVGTKLAPVHLSVRFQYPSANPRNHTATQLILSPSLDSHISPACLL